MKSLIKRFNLILVVTALSLSFFMFLVIYLPMKTELEKNLLENFNQISSSKYNFVQNKIQNCVEGAMSLSSRTMINKALINFQNRKLSIDELKSFTQPKYEDGAKVLKNIIQAERIAQGHSVSIYRAPNRTTEKISWYTTSVLSDKVITQIIIDKEAFIVMVISPILNEGIVLGYDYVAYDISADIQSLNTAGIETELIDMNDYNHYTSTSKVLFQEDYQTLQHESRIVYLENLIPETYFIASEEQALLFKPVKDVSIRILSIWLVTIVGFTSLVYLYIVRYAKRALNHLEFSRDKFQAMAYRDDLTGAYSRTFLDIWYKNLRDEAFSYSIILIDIDNFKHINDVYGHVMGDSVLKKLVQLITDMIRQTDLLIRYGGDEFIILLPNDNHHEASSLMKRICDKLETLEEYDFVVHISYGISTLKNHDIFEEKLELADQQMYLAKQEYKKTN